MPTYVYKCDNCGEFEIQQSINDDAYKICPKCNGDKIRRMITNTAGIIMKDKGQKSLPANIPPQCKGCGKINECDIKEVR
ncbi:MAG: hypothetical protein N3E50_05885 [Candidatus Goldbacteria bacterium]|nr:hypothetical protein [Candidatus Goldiibacteriota bacterium]